jgi:hypothetical protein
MNYGSLMIDKLIAEVDTADNDLLILIYYLLQRIDKKKSTVQIQDLTAIIEATLLRREIDIDQI